MQLEDYFEFEKFPWGDERIRIKGRRIAIEYLIQHFLEGESPEMIVRRYHPVVNLEQVYATITYYLHNKGTVDAYMQQRHRDADDAAYAEYLKQEPSPAVKRLRALKAEQAQGGAASS